MPDDFRWPGIPDPSASDFNRRVKETLEILTTGRKGEGRIPPGIQRGIDESVITAREGSRIDLGTFISEKSADGVTNHLSFSSGFDKRRFSGYEFFFDGIRPSAAEVFRIRLSTDGGATYDATVGNYKWVTEQRVVETSASFISASSTDTGFHLTSTTAVNTTAVSALSGSCKILIPSDSANHASVFAEIVYRGTTGNVVAGDFTGRYLVAARVNAVRFFFVNTPIITSGSIAMHGIRKA
jgi:hypothetical protein